MAPLALAGQLGVQGFEVRTGHPPLAADGRIVRSSSVEGRLPVVTAVAESVAGETKLIEADEAAPGH